MRRMFVYMSVIIIMIILVMMQKFVLISLFIGEKIAWVIIQIKLANEVTPAPVGMAEGDTCNRGSCTGSVWKYGGICTCHHGSPPCFHCVEGHINCDTCDYDSQEHGEGLDYDQEEEDKKFYSGNLGEPWKPGK